MGLGSAMAGGNPADERQERDFYPTPTEVTKALIAAETFYGPIVEPACGDGAMGKVFEAMGLPVQASDIHPLGYGTRRDFFDIESIDPDASIVTNPPFDLAADFIAHGLSLKPRKLCLVLKATYWHAASRGGLFQKSRPAAVYPLLWRPDFLGKGRPTMDVCWTVWRRGHVGPTVYQPLQRPA